MFHQVSKPEVAHHHLIDPHCLFSAFANECRLHVYDSAWRVHILQIWAVFYVFRYLHHGGGFFHNPICAWNPFRLTGQLFREDKKKIYIYTHIVGGGDGGTCERWRLHILFTSLKVTFVRWCMLRWYSLWLARIPWRHGSIYVLRKTEYLFHSLVTHVPFLSRGQSKGWFSSCRCPSHPVEYSQLAERLLVIALSLRQHSRPLQRNGAKRSYFIDIRCTVIGRVCSRQALAKWQRRPIKRVAFRPRTISQIISPSPTCPRPRLLDAWNIEHCWTLDTHFCWINPYVSQQLGNMN